MSEVYISGPAGKIEGRYHQSDNKSAPVALVLHPHPLHGGTMNNKVTYNIYKAFVESGFTVLRINFRGVGKSEGRFDSGEGELSDASAAMDWLQLHNSEASHFWVAGFSFGAWVAMHLIMRRPEVEAFICAAPPATNHDFSFLVPCPASGLVVQGDKDEIAKIEDVDKMIEELQCQNSAQVEYEVIEDADHFFEGKIDELKDICQDYIDIRIATRVAKPIRKKRRRRRKKRIT